MMGIIVKYDISTPVALDALVFVALFAYKNTTTFAYLIGFVFGYLFTADFTFDGFHKAIYDLRLALLGGGHSSRLSGGRSGVIKSPYLIEADKIEDGEGAPLVLIEVEIRDGLNVIFPCSSPVGHIAFGQLINRDE